MPPARAERELRTYALHGLRVRSAVRLDAPVVRTSACDIEIRWGDRRAVPDAVPDGDLLAHLDFTDGGSSLTAGPEGYTWRVHGVCEFAVDRARRSARVHLAPDTDEEAASLLVGSFLAKILTLDGHCMLHASAIEVDRGAVAFIGASGMGKTTVAALCCIAGARVVTDDALRVEVREGAGWCYTGSRELRLRPAAAKLAAHLASAPRRSTLDARTAVRPGAAGGARLPLVALVAPRCAREASEPRIERLGGAGALLELLRYPRTIGWIGAEPVQREFDVLACLAACVPVYRAELPWGPQLDPQLGRVLLERLGLEAHLPGWRQRVVPVAGDRGTRAC